jgi:hypothetical protein
VGMIDWNQDEDCVGLTSHVLRGLSLQVRVQTSNAASESLPVVMLSQRLQSIEQPIGWSRQGTIRS